MCISILTCTIEKSVYNSIEKLLNYTKIVYYNIHSNIYSNSMAVRCIIL